MTPPQVVSRRRGADPGGYLVWKRVPTVVRPHKSCGCRKLPRLKEGGCQIIISSQRGAVTVLNINNLDEITVSRLKIILMTPNNISLVGSHMMKQRN